MEQKTSPSQPLDFSAYQKPLTWLSVFKAALGKYIQAAVFIIFVMFFIGGIAFAVVAAGGFTPVLIATSCIFGLFIIAPFILVWRELTRHISLAKQALRLREFAPANGFTFRPDMSNDKMQGILFTNANTESTFESVVGGTYHTLPFLFGNAHFVTGSGKNRTETWYGIVRVKLSRHVPHVLLDSHHNNFFNISNFPGIKRNQRLQLEGDFNKYFDLYVPQGYERDALYFITPELMALLIDHGGKFDVELVDDCLFIYSSKTFALEDAAGVSGVFQMIDRIGAEFQENTRRYADANVGNRAANIVATPGKRLKQSLPWIAIIILVLSFLLQIVRWIAN